MEFLLFEVRSRHPRPVVVGGADIGGDYPTIGDRMSRGRPRSAAGEKSRRKPGNTERNQEGSMKMSAVARVAISIVAVVAAAAALGYPDKPVQYIIPFAPAGESDVAARLQAQVFATKFGKEMIVINKPGAGGGLVWSQMNNMPADGHTIIGVNLPHIVLQPLEPDASFKTEDITPVYFFHYTPDALIVAADSPFKTFNDLVNAARSKPETVTIAGSGT